MTEDKRGQRPTRVADGELLLLIGEPKYFLAPILARDPLPYFVDHRGRPVSPSLTYDGSWLEGALGELQRTVVGEIRGEGE